MSYVVWGVIVWCWRVFAVIQEAAEVQAIVDELRRQTDDEARQFRDLETKQRQARDKFLSDERQAQLEAKRQADSYARNKKALEQEIVQLNAAIVAAAAERDARAEKIRSRLDNRLESKAVSLNASSELRGVVDKVLCFRWCRWCFCQCALLCCHGVVSASTLTRARW